MTWNQKQITRRFRLRMTGFGIRTALAHELLLSTGTESRTIFVAENIGKADPDWPDLYAEYMVREQTGAVLPQ